MIRVGVIGDLSSGWVGGINYLKNLTSAIALQPERKIEFYLFISKSTDQIVKDELSPYCTICEVPLLQRYSFDWFCWKIIKKTFNSDFWLSIALRKYKINIFSHSDTYRTLFTKSVNWIPDFQHLHLPWLFSEKEKQGRNRRLKNIIKNSDLIIVSSQDSMEDLLRFHPVAKERLRLLHFVALPNQSNRVEDKTEEEKVLKKFSITTPYFFLPNQFWKHKNHLVVIEALALLKEQGHRPHLICSGLMDDFRNKDHIEKIKLMVNDLKLEVKFLGLIDYQDVVVLMKNSISVVNPSLFEGWSSTVEECKVLGVHVLLSQINVHKEQNPKWATYFDPSHPQDLSKLMLEIWKKSDEYRQHRPMSSQELDAAVKAFALGYENIITGLLKETP